MEVSTFRCFVVSQLLITAILTSPKPRDSVRSHLKLRAGTRNRADIRNHIHIQQLHIHMRNCGQHPKLHTHTAHSHPKQHVHIRDCALTLEAVRITSETMHSHPKLHSPQTAHAHLNVCVSQDLRKLRPPSEKTCSHKTARSHRNCALKSKNRFLSETLHSQPHKTARLHAKQRARN